jgi:hypothetical protein
MNEYLVKAIKKLRPTAEFSLQNDDYSTIQWDVLDGKAPSQEEINKAIEAIKLNDIAETQAKMDAKQAILDRLGITAEEAALLLG